MISLLYFQHSQEQIMDFWFQPRFFRDFQDSLHLTTPPGFRISVQTEHPSSLALTYYFCSVERFQVLAQGVVIHRQDLRGTEKSSHVNVSSWTEPHTEDCELNVIIYSPSCRVKPVWLSLKNVCPMTFIVWRRKTDMFLIWSSRMCACVCVFSQQVKSYRFGTKWGFVVIFDWTMPLIPLRISK